MQEKKKSSLVLGILSIVLGLLIPIVGLILGIIGLGLVNSHQKETQLDYKTILRANLVKIKRLITSLFIIIHYINPFTVKIIPAIQLMIEITMPMMFRIFSVL